jgi:heme exporter protein CcmB
MTALILRELRLAATGGNALLPLIFFLLVATLFPFAVGPDRPLLARPAAVRCGWRRCSRRCCRSTA